MGDGDAGRHLHDAEQAVEAIEFREGHGHTDDRRVVTLAIMPGRWGGAARARDDHPDARGLAAARPYAIIASGVRWALSTSTS